MRYKTAAQIKGSKRVLQREPKQGTKIRVLYELFQMNKGVVLNMPLTNIFPPRYVYNLIDFYGMYIRRVGYGQWILVGEWFGAKYVDYVASNKERLADVEKQVINYPEGWLHPQKW